MSLQKFLGRAPTPCFYCGPSPVYAFGTRKVSNSGIRQVSDTLSAFIQKNGVRAFMDPSLALCIAKPNRVFLSPLPAAQVPFKDSLVARMLLTDAPARDKLIQLIGDGKSPAIVDLACSEFAKWIVAKATIGAA